MLILPPCYFRYGVVVGGKPMIKCLYEGERIIPISECYGCKIPYETNEELQKIIDENVQIYDEYMQFIEKIEKPIADLLKIVDRYVEKASSIRGCAKEEECCRAVCTILLGILVETAKKYGNDVAYEAFRNVYLAVKCLSNPHFDRAVDTLVKYMREKHGLDV